jgi:hypothetical protein
VRHSEFQVQTGLYATVFLYSTAVYARLAVAGRVANIIEETVDHSAGMLTNLGDHGYCVGSNTGAVGKTPTQRFYADQSRDRGLFRDQYGVF